MPTPFLAVNYGDGTTPQVRRYVGGQAATQGVTFGALEVAGTESLPFQRVFRVTEDTWIVPMFTSIYRTTDAGASYSAVYTDADLGGAAKCGPYLLYPGGVPTLVVISRSGAGLDWYRHTSTDFGATWSKAGPTVSPADNNGFPIVCPTVWRGRVYGSFRRGQGAGFTPFWGSWDPNGITFTNFAVNTREKETAFCVYKDRLFCVYNNGGTGDLGLYEFSGSNFALVATLQATPGFPGVDAKYTAFVDVASDTLVVLAHRTSTPAWLAYSITSALVVTNITSAINLAGVFGVPGSLSRIASIVDGSDPGIGGDPDIFLGYSPNGTVGTGITWAQWNGIASPISGLSSGGNTQHCIPWGVQVGGNCFWTTGQRHGSITNITNSVEDGRMTISFKLYSPKASPDPVSVSFFYAAATRAYAGTPKATLIDPSAGALSGGNTITGLDAADNGVTTFTVDWETQFDGFAIGDVLRHFVIQVEG